MAQGSDLDNVIRPGQFAAGGGGSGSNDPPVEARLVRLEAAVDAVRLDLAEIKGKLSNMPTTVQLVFMQVAVILTVFFGAFALLKFGSPH
jgi:hypothetical protein